MTARYPHRLAASTLALTAAVLTLTAAPAAAQDYSTGSDAAIPLFNQLVQTGSAQTIIGGSNEAAESTGSSNAAGLLFCGLLSLSNGNNPTICDTGPLG
ncbi:hypothetical protein [Nocardia sp. AG03]|uniref:hypothetical protein n=1 Tax=Nocardia sp. AG03 TaxID=3025312 RepID=UPI002418A612|nr:hypothetical protein [Nocardia sp. AG03]